MTGLDVLGGFLASAAVVVLLAVLDYCYCERGERRRRGGSQADSGPPITD